MQRFICRSVGYDANRRGEFPTVTVEAENWTGAVGEVLGQRVSFVKRINELSSIYAAYVPSATGGHSKIGCVEHIRTDQAGSTTE